MRFDYIYMEIECFYGSVVLKRVVVFGKVFIRLHGDKNRRFMEVWS